MSLCYVVLALKAGTTVSGSWSADQFFGIPSGAELLVAGLIGTTVVPYNLFLGSGIASGTDIKSMRIGLGGAIFLGGVISLSIMMAGAMIPPDFSFQKMYTTFHQEGNQIMAVIAALGLFAAGLSSAITCPLAAALTAEIMLSKQVPGFSRRKPGFHGVWIVVLGIGGLFMFLNGSPVSAIITAQAINGMLLPIVAFLLLLLVNNSRVLAPEFRNGLSYNILSCIILMTIIWLGMNSLQSVAHKLFGWDRGYWLNWALAATGAILFMAAILRKQRPN